MTCIDCRYNLLKDGHCNCTYEGGECIKISVLEKENAKMKTQIEKMKFCENCAWWYKLPNGQRDCAETCENRDNWSLRR